MNMWLTYGLVAVILVIAELIYFRIADKCNIIYRTGGRTGGERGDGFSDLKVQSVAVQSCFTNNWSQQ